MPPSTLDDLFQPPSSPTRPASPKWATKNKGFLFIFLSLLWLVLGGLAIGGITTLAYGDAGPPVSLMMGLVIPYLAIFVGLFFVGTGIWAKAKGYHPIIGVLLAWVGPMGLVILAILPDKSPGPVELG